MELKNISKFSSLEIVEEWLQKNNYPIQKVGSPESGHCLLHIPDQQIMTDAAIYSEFGCTLHFFSDIQEIGDFFISLRQKDCYTAIGLFENGKNISDSLEKTYTLIPRGHFEIKDI